MTMTAGFFTVIASGDIESAYIPNADNLYCKFALVYGPDWAVISGLEEGISQIARAASVSKFSGQSKVKPCVWNFPLDAVFKSTNVFGWPQLVVSIYGLDDLGRDIVRGYGSLRLPLTAGSHTLHIPLFAPVATSPFNGFLSWIAGRLPEFLDPKFVSKNQGREITRVKSHGSAKVKLNLTMRDLDKFGFKGVS